MRIAFSLRNISCSLAVISFLAVGAASAQTLAGVNATLDHSFNSKGAKTGEVVTARLTSSVKTPDGVDLPKGTELVGKVAAVKAETNGGVSVSLLFDAAKLKDGKQVPVKATLLAAYPASTGNDGEDSVQVIGAPPAHVISTDTFDQEPGALGHVSLKSAVKSDNSGTFASSDGNFKLGSGTYLQIAVAGTNSGNGTSAAE